MANKKSATGKKNAARPARAKTAVQKKSLPDGVIPAVREESPPAVRQEGRDGFPIVGIGASAGGLEAFEQFFTHMPPDSGMGFVLIPHLDPTHKTIMPELLQRYSKIPVVQAEEGMESNPTMSMSFPRIKTCRY